MTSGSTRLDSSQMECRVDVECHGDPYSMGMQQGVALRGKMALIDKLLPRLEAFRLAQPRWLPYRAFLQLAERKAHRLLSAALSRADGDFSDRLQGIAAGSGVRPGLLYLLNALECLLASTSRCTVVPPIGACSAIAVRGSRSTTGQPLVARNFDYLPLVQPLYSLRRSKPSAGYAAIEFVAAPMAGTIDGMNECGLCITYNYAFTVDDAKANGAPISSSISRALQQCQSVTEAAEQISAAPRWGGGLLMLADESGDIASLELSTSKARLRRPRPDEDALFHSNAFQTHEMRTVQVSDCATFTRQAPAALRGKRVLDSAARRDARFSALLDAHAVLALEDLTCLMADHGGDSVTNDGGLCVHTDYWETTACLQFEPCSRRMRVSYSSACSPAFQEFTV